MKFLFFLLTVSLYLYFFRIPFPGVDDAAYKEPAYRISQGLSLSAPAFQGRRPGSEKLFVIYPPIHSVLLGGWFHLFGFSLGSSLLFSLLVCGFIAVLCILLCRRAVGDPLPNMIYGFAFVAWALALSGIHRPDPLHVMFGLLLLWALLKKPPCPSGCRSTHLLFVLLIALYIGASPGMGVFMFPYFGAVFAEVFGFTRRSCFLFARYFLLGVVLVLCAWALVFRRHLQLFWDQFLRRALTLQVSETALRGAAAWKSFLEQNLHVSLCFPLVFLLFMAALRWAWKGPSSPEKRVFRWKLLTLLLPWFFFLLVRTKATYLTMIHIYMLTLCGPMFLRWMGTIHSPFRRSLLAAAAWGFIAAAALPFLRMALTPLTWEEADSYEYNGKRILSQIRKGTTVLTDVEFWHLLVPKHRIYDAHFSPSKIFESEYVLLAGAGSGRPDAVRLPFTVAERKYFDQNFVRKDSTLSDAPNRLWGWPIARCRWSYRYNLYERVHKPS